MAKHTHDPERCVCGPDTWRRGTPCPCQCPKCHRKHDADCGQTLERSCDACRKKMLAAWEKLEADNAAITERHRIYAIARQFQVITGISIRDLRAALLAEAKKP